ncbi:MAG: 30S ribosomal protein S7 [Candidatus Thermoplasmatota archaeon]|nr:30S ribosomal protein S7 [Candidatus Thermoplasmatota archaeon]
MAEEKIVEQAQPVAEAPKEAKPKEYLIFGKYDTDVVINDPGLGKYMNLAPIIVPHTGARHANKAFAKSRVSVVERLINKLMRTQKYTGKKMSAYNAVKDAFEMIAAKTKKNPVQVFVEAIQNAAPREEVTRLSYAGITVPKAVDVAPSRRVDVALRNLATSAIQGSKGKGKDIENRLADELINASKNSMNSFAVTKKAEVERVSKSAR